jgi:NAD(P)-dependent dehydrogenase (short-subunit alcohol dehydrogenase family)
MAQRTWFITGVSSGFGRELTKQLLARGDRVVGTVRDISKVATNLVGPIQLIRAALPHLRAHGGRVIQISSYGGQVAFPGNSLYHATKRGIEGFVESVAQEVASFGIGMTLVEPGGARTEFRYGSAQVAELMPVYDQTPAHSFLRMLSPKNGLAPGDPARMAARIIESVDVEPAPLRMVLGSQALESTLTTLRKRIANFEAQTELAASTDFAPGE